MQIPNTVLGALSECFCNVTAYELAYARSPPGMKALVVSLFLATSALSNAFAEILSPAIKDPYLVWIWAGPAIALALQTVIFWFKYKKFNDDEFMTYEDLMAIVPPRKRALDGARDSEDEKDEKDLHIRAGRV